MANANDAYDKPSIPEPTDSTSGAETSQSPDFSETGLDDKSVDELMKLKPGSGPSMGGIRQGYRKWMAQSPMHASISHSVPLALLGYYGLPWILRKAFGAKNIRERRSKIVGAILGGLAPALPASMWYRDRQMDPKRDWSTTEALLEPSEDLWKKSSFPLGVSQGAVEYTQPAFAMLGQVTNNPALDRPSIGLNTALATIETDPNLSPGQRLQAKATVQMAAQAAGQTSKGGLVSTNDLIRSAIGGGVGYAAGRTGGALMGTFFGLSPLMQRRLAQAGMVAGIARATGIWK